MFDPYGALGLLPGATPEEVTAAYRSLAQANHPDRGGDTARMVEINRAYHLLSDPVLRADYEESRAALTAASNPLLARIRESVRGKTPMELAALRIDIAKYVRDLELQFATSDLELAHRFGQEHADRERSRLERHRAELVFLDQLLESTDPVAAEAAKGDALEGIKRRTAGMNVYRLRELAVEVSRNGTPAEIAYLDGLIAARASDLAA